jgi:hypothetical protein
MSERLTCVVCGKPITSGLYSHHQRLNVDIHGGCPRTNVCGEDITMHSMLMVRIVEESSDE